MPTSRKAIVFLIGAGVLNGFALLAFGKLMDTPKLVPVALAMMLMVPVVGAPFLFGDPFTRDRAIGLAFGVLAVYFLNR